ncbi:uncharacterized protein N7498_005027 [Penicillium cinerascens]|uniref:Uncharacterized protein n=1 Tax=Penicillium cinerascens TaxID=70096 RepID=A0A9W9MMS2_9EURO|nr:uncharacterized protein N7498_005027 [Penicillium cinerascens]KAJ5204148.1 hypothetical protein N7498_005027 [Penicillium cinerascens]
MLAGWTIDLQSSFKSSLPPRDRVESAHLAVQMTKDHVQILTSSDLKSGKRTQRKRQGQH